MQLAEIELLGQVTQGVPRFVVNTTDSNDDGTCDAAHCSLREAANTTIYIEDQPVEIAFSPLFNTPQTITLSQTLRINNSVAIIGPGANLLTVASPSSDAFYIYRLVNGVVISGMTLRGNDSDTKGINSDGSITVTNCVIRDFGGAGIYTSGSNSTVSNCTFIHNAWATIPEGTVGNSGGTFNYPGYSLGAGAIGCGGVNSSSNSTTVVNCTFSDNYQGVMVYNSNATATVTNSTFSQNREAVALLAGTVNIGNSILQGSTSSNFHDYRDTEINYQDYLQNYNNDIHYSDGTLNSQGYNISSDGTGPNASNDRRNTDARLGSLNDNGGQTPTISLRSDSPALNAGSTGLQTDQRGVARPQGSGPDIGAYEAAMSVVIQHPADLTVNEGTEATFTALVEGMIEGTGVYNDASQLSNDQRLLPGQSLYSPNHGYRLTYQGDGNMVLYSATGKALWSAGTSGTSAGHVKMQSDGNLVVYDANGVVKFASDTGGNSGAVLRLQNDGNLVIYSSGGAALWSTSTSNVGDPVADVQWQVSSDSGVSFSDIPGATSTTLRFTAQLADNGKQYRAVFRNIVGTVTTNAAKLTVISGDTAPVGNAQSLTTDEDSSVAITLTASDFDNDPLIYAVTQQPAHGTLSGTAPALTYTPATNYNGSDSFKFKANDGQLDSAEVTVSIQINAVNDPPVATDDSGTTDEDTALILNVKANDSDVDGDTLRVSSVANGAHGTAKINSDGTVTYTPSANYNGSDSFTYVISDNKGGTDEGEVKVTVNAINDAPVAKTGSVTTTEDTSVDITLQASDVDSANLSYGITKLPSHGTLSNNGQVITQTGAIVGNKVTYTPDVNYPLGTLQDGYDNFNFMVFDGAAYSNEAQIAVTISAVSDQTIAYGDSYIVDEDRTLAVAASGVLSNDEEFDGGLMRALKVSDPAHGTLTLNANGAFTYVPEANYNGQDSFIYKANNGFLDSNTMTVKITVDPVNDAPVAKTDSGTTAEDTTLTLNVKANDSDVDGDTLRVSSVANGAHGTVKINSDGTVTYTPSANYNGSDSFSYTVADNGTTHGVADSKSAIGTVNLTITPVNDAPVATNDAYTMLQKNSLVVAAPGILSSDKDIDSTTITAVKKTDPAHGSVTFSADGSFTYTPLTNYTGTDSFTYTASDGLLESNTTTVTITVEDPKNPSGTIFLSGTADSATDTVTLTFSGALAVASATNPATYNVNAYRIPKKGATQVIPFTITKATYDAATHTVTLVVNGDVQKKDDVVANWTNLLRGQNTTLSGPSSTLTAK